VSLTDVSVPAPLTDESVAALLIKAGTPVIRHRPVLHQDRHLHQDRNINDIGDNTIKKDGSRAAAAHGPRQVVPVPELVPVPVSATMPVAAKSVFAPDKKPAPVTSVSVAETAESVAVPSGIGMEADYSAELRAVEAEPIAIEYEYMHNMETVPVDIVYDQVWYLNQLAECEELDQPPDAKDPDQMYE
jgi:hypothetical protein